MGNVYRALLARTSKKHAKIALRLGIAATIAAPTLTACGGAEATEIGGRVSQADSNKLNTLIFTNDSGTMRTYSDNNKVMFKPNKIQQMPFFTSFGTNGRACIHCHMPGDAWSVTPADIQFRFSHPLDTSNSDCLIGLAQCPADPDPTHWGSDPIFRPIDGATSPNADVSTAAARSVAYALLLNKGLIRVGIGIPTNAEFDLTAVDDPYGYASATELSLFRRPLPATNLRLSPTGGQGAPAPTPVLTAVMWDGRETLPGNDILSDLLDQANGATLGHAQATAGLSDADRQAIVDFETGLHTAQQTDAIAGDLSVAGGNGGPGWLAANQPFYPGMNDVLAGDSQTNAPFNPDVFNLYFGWVNSASASQAQIARGEALFNRKSFAITGVGGLNDALGIASIPGSCTTCHDSPNYGHHSVKLPINVGVADGARRTPDLPLYTLRNRVTGATVQTTDPGRALISGKWADVGKFKGPILRGLAGRAPYFHNGSAATVSDAISFYDTRFQIGFSDAEKSDLAAFLLAL